MTDRVPVVLCIDIEPDPRQVSMQAPEPWRGYELARPAIEELRAELARVTGAPAHFLWCMRFDEQIEHAYGSLTWSFDNHRDHLDRVREQGDAFGLHPHPYRWAAAEGAWRADYGNPSVTAETLRGATDAFAAVFGEPCRLLHHGDGWMDLPTLDLAESLGIEIDLTLEPGGAAEPFPPEEHMTGSLPDRRTMPHHPYTPHPDDLFRPADRPSDRRIVELPITTVQVRSRRPWRRPWISLAPWRDWSVHAPFGTMIDQVLGASDRPYLAMAIRTGDFNREPYGDHMVSALAALVAHPEAPRFVACTPHEAVERLAS